MEGNRISDGPSKPAFKWRLPSGTEIGWVSAAVGIAAVLGLYSFRRYYDFKTIDDNTDISGVVGSDGNVDVVLNDTERKQTQTTDQIEEAASKDIPLVTSFLAGKEVQVLSRDKTSDVLDLESLKRVALTHTCSSLHDDTVAAVSISAHSLNHLKHNASHYFMDNGLFNLDNLNEEFKDVIDSISKIDGKIDHFYNEHDGFNSSRDRVKHLCRLVHTNLNSLELSQFQKQFDFSINGAYHSFISDLFSFQKSGDLYYSMTAASICIPFLEAFLGEWIREHHKVNVEPVQTNTTTAPRIPRRMTELLDMPQLKEILSPIMLLIIKISIGPPPGLNIRNLLWHGFLSDGEFQIEITSLLILLICQLLHQNRSTFGHLSVIKKKNIQEWIDKLKFSVSCNIFGEGREGELNSIEPLLNKSFFIIPSQKSQWRLAFSFLKKQENYLSTIVLIPLLEHSIRRVFAVSNECGSRVLTARVHSLMTTMDTLLDDFIETTPNLIFNEFGQNIMHILHDLFIAKQGPRIRDLIAHGVVEETTIPTYFSNCLAALAIYLCLKYDVDNNGLKDYFKIYNSDLLERVVDFVENYKPLFHPKSYQLRTVNEIYKRWIVLQNLCNEPDITPEPLTPEMIHYRDSFISCLEHPYFATNSNEKDYEYSFDVTMGKDQSRVLVLVSKIQERILKIIEELISSYETLKQRIEGFNSSKSQRQNFFLLQRNISHFSWFIQFSMISLEAILHTQKHDLIDQLLEWLEQYGKAMGLVHTRISKNEYAATKEMFELIVGQDDQNMKLVSSREKKLIAGTAPLLEKIFLPPKE